MPVKSHWFGHSNLYCIQHNLNLGPLQAPGWEMRDQLSGKFLPGLQLLGSLSLSLPTAEHIQLVQTETMVVTG